MAELFKKKRKKKSSFDAEMSSSEEFITTTTCFSVELPSFKHVFPPCNPNDFLCFSWSADFVKSRCVYVLYWTGKLKKEKEEDGNSETQTQAFTSKDSEENGKCSDIQE